MTPESATPGDWGARAEEQEGLVVRDRRRIDPETGELRLPTDNEGADVMDEQHDAGPMGPADAAPSAEGTDLQARVAELEQERDAYRDDLKRVQAEYVNYKRRVDRDRESVREVAVGGALAELLPVLDDIGRAREHGELEGGFKAVAEALESALTKLGLERYGEVGDPFDPRIHEALMHQYSDEVDGPTCLAILQPGYRHGERILRPTRVAVAEPTAGLSADGQVDAGGPVAGSSPSDGSGNAGAPEADGESGTGPGGEPFESGER